MATYASCCLMKWNDQRSITGRVPRPRFGHRVASLNDSIVFMGGGNDLITRDIHLYDYVQKKWRQPEIKGKMPPGVASFGLVIYNENIIIFGGMDDNRHVTDGLFELDTSSWRWSQHFPSHDSRVFPPCARFGHSFVLADDNKVYMFGGVTNPLFDVAKLGTEVLNDFYALDLSNGEEFKWLALNDCIGNPPSPRESHTCVFYKSDAKRELIFYGGSDGTKKLGDVHIFDLNSNTWFNLVVTNNITNPIPPARSMHTAVCFNNRMIVFGGWIGNTDKSATSNRNKLNNANKPITNSNVNNSKEFITTSGVACFDIDKKTWLDTTLTHKESVIPSGRAGHAAILIGSRMYVFSGRDGYRKSRAGLQTCFSDLWVLDLAYPLPPRNITLESSTCNSLVVKWEPIVNADNYLVQVYVTIPVENLTPPASKTEDTPTINTAQPHIPSVATNLPNAPDVNRQSRKRSMPPTLPTNIPAVEMSNQIPPPVAQILSTPRNTTPKYTASQLVTTPTNLPALKVVNMTDFNRIHRSTNQLASTEINCPTNNMPNFSNTIIPNSLNINPTSSSPPGSNMKTIESITGSDGKAIPVVNLSKMGLSLAQLSKSVTFVTTKGGDLVAQLPYDQLRNFFKLNQNTSLPASVSPQTSITVALSSNSSNSLVSNGTMKGENNQNSHSKQPNANTKNTVNNEPKKLISGWYDVSIEAEPKATIKSYCTDNIEIRRFRDSTYMNSLCKQSLTPGETYKVRVASINACGVGKFSETMTYLLPPQGLLGPPGNVKLIKKTNGLFVEWDHPSKMYSQDDCTNTNGDQVDFILYMASKLDDSKFIYKEVYCGEHSQCLISDETLESAYVDAERAVPAITFRIVAKNSNGTGPATQVRWVQQ